jgi:predicted DCC family thiol-disulfide oxidoreductase YuxK
MPESNKIKPPIVIFDGVCRLCNFFVNFIIKADKAAKIKFLALQKLEEVQLQKGSIAIKEIPDLYSSVVVIDEGQILIKSAAVFSIFRHLPYPYKLLLVFRILPKPLNDFIYDFVARHRYAWFGKNTQCMIPSPEVLDRFYE